MKIKSDFTFQLVIIFYGIILLLLVLILAQSASIVYSLCIIPIVIIFYGFWKMESYEICNKKIIKYNFWKIFKVETEFNTIINFKKKTVNTDYVNNPFNIIKLFSKNQKYFIFQEITITTNKNDKFKFDERLIDSKDFNELLKFRT